MGDSVVNWSSKQITCRDLRRRRWTESILWTAVQAQPPPPPREFMPSLEREFVIQEIFSFHVDDPEVTAKLGPGTVKHLQV
jgi:hypothetical protein